MVIFPTVVKTAAVIFSHRDQHVIQHSRLTVHTVIHHMCHHVYSLPELIHTIDTRIDPSVKPSQSHVLYMALSCYVSCQ